MGNLPIDIIIFTKDRPLQLDLLIRSLSICEDINDIGKINIIAKASHEIFEVAYNSFSYNPGMRMNLVIEKSFYEDLKSIVENSSKYICFMVDDNICSRPFSFTDIIDVLDIYGNSIGFSLRLGKNITGYQNVFPHKKGMANFHEIENNFLMFEWKNAGHNFDYPMEVSSSVYKKEDILKCLEWGRPGNPNEFESLIASRPQEIFKNYLICHKESVCYVNQVNTVQEAYQPRDKPLNRKSCEHLLGLYLLGYRIKISPLIETMPNECHAFREIEIEKAP